jgi:predicted metalloendopeptidase
VSIAGFADQKNVRVYQPSYLQSFGQLFRSASFDQWKDYYTWRLLTASAPYLSSDFARENFNFFSKTLQGVEEQRPRWKRGVSLVQRSLGFMLGKVYVEKHFKPEAKQRMVTLVKNLRVAFKERIDGLEWMGDATKEKAHAKLKKFSTKIGYPDVWRDYAKLEINPDDLIENVRKSGEFETQRQLDKLGKPIDREEWGMTPQTVNAYYSPTMNEIVFPAAILQPPFFNLAADDAVNYGGIGAVIGHELSHGFDDQGRKYDGEGNLTDWWTEEDGKEFERRADVMVAQYDAYNPIDTMKVNGRFTLGENIGDLGGLTIAYHAYQNSLDGKEAPVIDGMTGDQRFFLGWAQVWARKYRDDEIRRRLVVDPHALSQYRANGIVSNMPEFYEAFDVKEGDPMYRTEDIRVKIW